MTQSCWTHSAHRLLMIGLLTLSIGKVTLLAQLRLDLIPANAVWRYNATSNDLGTAWREVDYDDQGEGWLTAQALFGMDLDRYPLSFATPLPSPLPIAMYFRHTFDFAGNPLGVTLIASNLVEDGAVFYLNGARLGDIRVSNQNPLFGTFATGAPEPHAGWEVIQFMPTNLVQGPNVFAVELHQSAPGSVDAAMAVVLDAVLGMAIAITNEPVDQIAEVGFPATLSVEAGGSNPRYQWFKDDNAIAGANTATYGLANAQTNHTGNYSVTISNAFGVVTSRVARLIVVPDMTGPTLVSAETPVPGTNIVVIAFSEIIFPASAQSVSNYSIMLHRTSTSLVVTQAQVNGRQAQLRLASNLQADGIYILTVNNVQDNSPQRNEIKPNSQVLISLVRTVVPIDGLWRWDESGGDLGTEWREPDYDDRDWATGRSLFYFEYDILNNICGGAKNTAVSFGITTYYFRTRFQFDPSTGKGSLRLRHVTDDGAIFYLNGMEVHRFNMPSGPITSFTHASTRVGNAGCISAIPTPVVTNLVSGENVLAVEVHQSSDSFEPDIVFGAEVTVAFQPALPELFNLSLRPAGTNGYSVLEWSPAGILLQSASKPEGPWVDAPVSSPYLVQPTNAAVFYRLRSP